MVSFQSFYRTAWRGLCLLVVPALAFSVGPIQVVQANPGDLGTGPGGVGNTGGVSNLRLWLMGDNGVYSNTGCTVGQATNGGAVGCWQDQSGRSWKPRKCREEEKTASDTGKQLPQNHPL